MPVNYPKYDPKKHAAELEQFLSRVSYPLQHVLRLQARPNGEYLASVKDADSRSAFSDIALIRRIATRAIEASRNSYGELDKLVEKLKRYEHFPEAAPSPGFPLIIEAIPDGKLRISMTELGEFTFADDELIESMVESVQRFGQAKLAELKKGCE